MSEEAKIIDEKVLNDTLENLVSQIGNSNDKNAHSNIVDNPALSGQGSQHQLSAMYRNDWASGKIVDIIPDDMTREWRTFNGEITPDQIKQLEDEEDRIQLVSKFNLAHKWGRLYGTSFLVMSIDDGLEPSEPLDIDNLEIGSLRHIQPIDRFRINHADSIPIADPMDANFGMPELYRFNETSVSIHHTRLIRFDAVRLAYNDFRENNYFSDSVLKRLHDSIINFNTATAASASMIHEANVDIMKVKGLMNTISNPQGEDSLRKRFALASLLKSFNNMMLLDSDEELTTKTNTFAGLPDLIDKFSKILASASDIPATRLLGDSPSGMNSTGEGDRANYYDKIRSLQVTEYKTKLDTIDKIMGKSLGLPDDADLSYEFNPLLQLNEKEQADLENSRADRDTKYYNIGVVDEVIIAKDLQQQDTYTNLDDEYIKELEEIDNELDLENGIKTNTTEGESTTEPKPKEETEEEGDSGKGE